MNALDKAQNVERNDQNHEIRFHDVSFFHYYCLKANRH